MNKEKSMKQKKIAFILPEGSLPIPATMGGAIETLMTMMLNENETKGNYDFLFVYSGEENKKVSYKHSVCYACKLHNRSGKVWDFLTKVWYKLGTYFPKSFPAVSRYYRDAAKIAKKEKADYVIAEGLYPTNFKNFSYIWDKKNLALHIHSEVAKNPVSDEILEKTIAISDFVAQRWNENTPEKMKDTYVWKNSIRREKFDVNMTKDQRNEVRKSLGYYEDDFVVFFCGRMIQVKGVKELIEAVLGIENEKVKLLIIGSDDFARGDKGEYAKEVRALVEKNPDRIKHLGYVDNAKLYQYYKSADLQVVPSLWEEAAGLVAIEGMVSKIPLIVTKSGGMIEYVHKDYTKIVPKDEHIVQTLQKEIVYLYENPSVRDEMSQGAYDFAKRFSQEQYYQDFCDMMEQWEKDIQGR